MEIEMVIAIAGIVVAFVSAVGALLAARHASRANVRADKANYTAERALDLQARIDARAREFREVKWNGHYASHESRPVFKLNNTGLTPAHSVTLVFAHKDQDEVVYKLGDIQPGDSANVEYPGSTSDDALDNFWSYGVPFRVHWSSPLGHAERYAPPTPQIG